jgi:hypothetical protein
LFVAHGGPTIDPPTGRIQFVWDHTCSAACKATRRELAAILKDFGLKDFGRPALADARSPNSEHP